MSINSQTLTFILSIVAILGVIFNVYNSYRSPQIETDKETLTLRQDFFNLRSEVKEVKENYLKALQIEVKNLSDNVNELAKTVIKLSTIIDERLPKASPNLTPPGV